MEANLELGSKHETGYIHVDGYGINLGIYNFGFDVVILHENKPHCYMHEQINILITICFMDYEKSELIQVHIWREKGNVLWESSFWKFRILDKVLIL